MRSAERNSARSRGSRAHSEITWPLADVTTGGGAALPRRARAASTMRCAEVWRSTTAIGNPPMDRSGKSSSFMLDPATKAAARRLHACDRDDHGKNATRQKGNVAVSLNLRGHLRPA